MTNYQNPEILAEVSEDLGEAMVGTNADENSAAYGGARKMSGALTVGVLAVQGAFAEHREALLRAGANPREIRGPRELDGIDALILPGGESTAQGRLLRELGLFEPVTAMIADGLPVFGTCAGMILLAKNIENDARRHFAAMDITVRRNGYGGSSRAS